MLFATAFLAISQAGPASAEGTAYPPPPSTCTALAANGAGVGGNSSCNVDPTSVTRSPSTDPAPSSTHSTESDLASTGFDSAAALVIVAALLVGGLVLLGAGRNRRRHS